MLKLKDIRKTFNPGSPNAKLALDGLSLDVAPGEFVSIIGANGAGKSTLFGAIAGEFVPDAGRVIIDGADVTLEPQHRRAKNIGRLFQDPMRGSAPGMSIEENLALASGRGGWFGSVKATDREFFRERLSQLGMGLEDRLKHPVGLLSGGQRQALTLVMATLNPPKLLLLDKVMELTDRTVREGSLTCLMITHNMQTALSFGSRTLMMDGGKIIFDTSGEERKKLTVPDLLDKFREAAGKALDSDRMLLTDD